VRVLLTLAWLLAILYATIPPLWLLIHPFADRWRAAKVPPAKAIGLLWLLIMIATALATARWRHLTLYLTPWSWLGWAIFFVWGASLYSRIGHFGVDNLIGRTELETTREQKLVTTGMHARVRHPIYLAHLLMLTAWAVGTGMTVLWALWVFALVSGIFMIRAEDAELERRFGHEFREYKRRVPAIFPRPMVK
jgi:protein-S-isoprenylcysteine O-methyltransferase Ste14